MIQREKLAQGLASYGAVRISHTSRKYWVYRIPATGAQYFLGANGAIRVGKTIKDSIPVSGAFRKILLDISTGAK